jgi:hypothetical protein
MGLLAPHVYAVTLAGCVVLLLVALAVADRIQSRSMFEVRRSDLVPAPDSPTRRQS